MLSVTLNRDFFNHLFNAGTQNREIKPLRLTAANIFVFSAENVKAPLNGHNKSTIEEKPLLLRC